MFRRSIPLALALASLAALPAAAQRPAPAGVRPPAVRAALAPAHRAPAGGDTAAAPAFEARGGQPSLARHLIVGTLAGAAAGALLGTASRNRCDESRQWCDVVDERIIGLAWGAGIGLVTGAVVYWIRARD